MEAVHKERLKELDVAIAACGVEIALGGPGSGNWAHVGRPSLRGGSQKRSQGMTIAKGQDWLKRYKKAAGKAHPFEEEYKKQIAQGKTSGKDVVKPKTSPKAGVDKKKPAEPKTTKPKVSDPERKKKLAQLEDTKKRREAKEAELKKEQDNIAFQKKEQRRIKKLWGTIPMDEFYRIREASSNSRVDSMFRVMTLEREIGTLRGKERMLSDELGIKPTDGGTPVSDALKVPRSKYAAKYNAALSAIDSVHGDGALPQIPVKTKSNMRYLGVFSHTWNGPKEIGINGKGDHFELTMAHEVGHFLDFSGLGSNTFLSDPGRNTPKNTAARLMRKAMDAIRNSPQVQTLMDKVKNPKKYVQTVEYEHNGEKRSYKTEPDRSHTRYLSSNVELWARAYAQYIATRSGNKSMIAQVAKQLESKLYGEQQWTTKDFEPIAEAIDELFNEMGWMK